MSLLSRNFFAKSFHFFSVATGTVVKEINNLKPKNAKQNTDIPRYNPKLSGEFFAEYTCS